LRPTPRGLAAGGGIGKVRTRDNNDVTYSVSYEPHPRLRQTARCMQVFSLLLPQ